MNQPLAFQRPAALSAALLLAVAALAGGCASTTPTGQGASPAAPASAGPRTASDQSDADRRAQVRMELAAAYFARGQNATALDEIKQALVADPNLGEAYNLRGLVYAAMGENTLAGESFRRALQINARDADAMHNYGWFLCQNGRYDEAEAMYEAAMAQPSYRGQVRTLMVQGVCHARAGRLAEAERALSRSYELDPASPATAINLAEVLLRRGELVRARFYIGRVNERPEQSSAETLWLAARVEHRAGDTAARDLLGRQLLNRFPRSPQALAYERGRFDE